MVGGEFQPDNLGYDPEAVIFGDIVTLLQNALAPTLHGKLQSPIRLAFLREAALASHLLGSGVTSLARATGAYTGYYNEAFLGLSQGFERTGKLVITADYMINNNGNLPTDNYLKKLGHDLVSIFAKVEEITTRVRAKEEYSERPSHRIHQNIITVLDHFAQITRYYNLDLLSGRKTKAFLTDPIEEWWNLVGEPIVDQHYLSRQKKKTDEMAQDLQAKVGHISVVRHTTEIGLPINDVPSMVQHNAKQRIVQRWGQFYALQLIRWITYTLRDLSIKGGYNKRIEALFCIHETFRIFMNDDQMLKKRSTWNVYRP
jgi:hypothetical protein